MDVQMPIYLYDVVTAAKAPRLIVTCRSTDDAQALASRLNAMRDEGQVLDADAFVVDVPRAAMLSMDVPKGTTVIVNGHEVDLEALSLAMDAQGKTPPFALTSAAKGP